MIGFSNHEDISTCQVSFSQQNVVRVCNVIMFVHRLKSKSSTGEVVTDPLAIFHQALENSQPIMGTIGVRRGGKLYQVLFFSKIVLFWMPHVLLCMYV